MNTLVRLINADTLKAKIDPNSEFHAVIDSTPTIEERKVAYWKDIEHDEYGDWIECTSCGEPAGVSYGDYYRRSKLRPEESDYCPNCGARMNGRIFGDEE